MSPERWRQIKQVLDAALERPAVERREFVVRHCGADLELRSEVESLLDAHEEIEGSAEFLDDVSPALLKIGEDGPDDPAGAEETVHVSEDAGMRVGPWQLVQEIGRGGMGVVYLAVRADSEFRKRVAIKLIRHGMENEFAVRRFRNERQIVARLEHPNIARLIDGGTTSRGLPYFVMEYVEGEPLLKYCETRGLGTNDRLETFLRVCSAVHYAHRRMIIHRDLKPGNVLVKQDGTPKLLDFGIAKLLDPDTTDLNPETTMVGVRMVTPAYASPEQMRGEPATVSSDVYSLGVILCELLAGCKPNALPQAQASGAAAAAAPARDLHPDLRNIILRAVRFAPEERYESVEALSADLQRFLDGTPVPHYDTTAPAAVPAQPPPAGSIAVLPFRLLDRETGSDAYLTTGITDAIITRLSNIGRISVRPTSAVLRYAALENAVAAGRELNVEFVLEGRVRRSGDRVRVSVQLIPVSTGSPAWAASFEEESRDLLVLEDSISGQVAQALVPQLSGEEQEQLAKRGTAIPKAHESYLRGRWYWNMHNEEALSKALLHFSDAIAEDPNYARAHAGIADYYIQLGLWGGMPPAESFAAAKEAAAKALAIDSSLAEAHASYGVAIWAYDRNTTEAAHHLQLAITLNPDYAAAHQWFGQLNSARGRHEMAIAALERARKLDPRSPVYAISLARIYINARLFDRAISDLTDPVHAPEDHWGVPEMLAWAYLGAGRSEEALECARRAAALTGRNVFALAVLACAHAAAGDPDSAAALIAEAEQSANTKYVSRYQRASILLAAGRRREALEMLAAAWNDRDWWSVWTAVDLRWDALRSEGRFRALTGARYAEPETVAAERRKPIGEVPKAWAAITVVVLLVVAGLLAWRLTGGLGPAQSPFTNRRVGKVTTNGTAARAAIAPDGSTVVYTTTEDGKLVLWSRALNRPTATRIAGPLDGEMSGIEVKGSYASFVLYRRSEPANGTLYRIAVEGGALEPLMHPVPGPASVSPDGELVAFYRANRAQSSDDLVVSTHNGGGERIVSTRRYPERFSWTSAPAWSANGRHLAVSVEGSDSGGFYALLAGVETSSGAVRVLQKPRFQYIERMAWAFNGAGVFVIGQEQESSFQQIWYLPYPSGEPKRISNDLNDYIGISVADDMRSLVSVQVQTLSNIYMLPRDNAGPAVQVTPGSGRYFDLASSPDGRILYASDASGTADIWVMQQDGGGQRLLTTGVGRSYAPAVSPDGRAIAFHSNRDGNWNLWRMDAEGAGVTQLTADKRDSNWPQFTPDGKYLVYHHTEPNAMWNLWRVPARGGEPERITTKLTVRPAVNPKDGRIACWYSAEASKPSWKLAVLAPDGGLPLQFVDVAPTVPPESTLRWTPDGEAITYVDGRGGVQNIWVHPLNGRPARAVTHFDWGQIYSFDWARDGRLIYSRGMSTSDVVLIRDVER